jgi:hypothetical protein
VTFEAFLEHYFTRKLNRCPKIIEDVEIRIANITFGFANQDLLKILTERGTLVAKGKFEKVPPLNEKIEQMSKEHRAEYIRPVAAFLTFERQEGKDRCLKYFADPNETRKVEDIDGQQEGSETVDLEARIIEEVDKALLGVDMVCYSACEPSDIVWENRHVTVHRRRIN